MFWKTFKLPLNKEGRIASKAAYEILIKNGLFITIIFYYTVVNYSCNN